MGVTRNGERGRPAERAPGLRHPLPGCHLLALLTPLLISVLNKPTHELFLLVFLVILWLQLLSEEAVNSSVLSLWAEALGRLGHTVLRPVHRTSLNDVSPVSLRPTLMGRPAFPDSSSFSPGERDTEATAGK